MPEYVYALHDFSPEHEDEISFSAGDRIEIIEKDEMYGDGWWQGKNLFGKIGLFPQSYTTSDPSILQPQSTPQNGLTTSTGAVTPTPATASTASDLLLQSVKEESTSNIGTPNGRKSAEELAAVSADNDGVMRATMTDVQEAIEQLGRNNHDGNGSFSFASSRSRSQSRATNSDKGTDTDVQSNDENNTEGWHKGARSSLAEKARRQQELLRKEQEAYDEELRRHAPVITESISEPPIEFELSDESEDEHEPDVTRSPSFGRREHSHISEEEEDEDKVPLRILKTINTSNSRAPSTPKNARPSTAPTGQRSLSNPWSASSIAADDSLGPPPETARQQHFPTASVAGTNGVYDPPKPKPPSHDTSIKPYQTSESFTKQASEATARPASTSPGTRNKMALTLPSPPGSQHGMSSSTSKETWEWSVEEVVDWAKSKGFDDSICEKFIEHEISGDVLLELDANVLKSELEIHAFGKRTRIIKEIDHLRRPRPPSVVSISSPSAQAHQRTISQSVSLPGSTHQSLRSPLALGAALSPESPPHTGDILGTPAFANFRRDSDPGSGLGSYVRVGPEGENDSSTAHSSALGLGIASVHGGMQNEELQNGKKNRPPYLNLSPSNASLRGKSTKLSKAIEEERATMSDTESVQALDARSRRRRMFGRSSGSQASDAREDKKSNGSKEQLGPATPVSLSTSTPGSPASKRISTEDGSVKGHQRRKRSVDANKQGDRLSLFGGSISISRSRKPAPRVQSSYDDLTTEKHGRSISRLYLGGSRKPSSTKFGSEIGSPKKARGSEESDPQKLRKRTSSQVSAVGIVPAIPGLATDFKPGVSVLEQIGLPDYNGWLRKKGEHYNTWKLRYFVLKGPHLYYLRSNSKAETKIKGYINIIGYKVIVDENINPGKYGFRLIHNEERTHFFSSDESNVVREWMKALMKATIGRDYTKPVISSCNIPTIPLSVAQTMNPAPRPPSPTQRAATQKALRRENPNQLSTRDARILMGLTKDSEGGLSDKAPMLGDNLFTSMEPLPQMQSQNSTSSGMTVPARPSRETRRTSVPPVVDPSSVELIRWANAHLPFRLQIPENNSTQVFSALALFRLAEAIKGRPFDPFVPDSAFPASPADDRSEGLVALFDLLRVNDVRGLGAVSLNDVRVGQRGKVLGVVRALRGWEERRAKVPGNTGKGGANMGGFMVME